MTDSIGHQTRAQQSTPDVATIASRAAAAAAVVITESRKIIRKAAAVEPTRKSL